MDCPTSMVVRSWAAMVPGSGPRRRRPVARLKDPVDLVKQVLEVKWLRDHADRAELRGCG